MIPKRKIIKKRFVAAKTNKQQIITANPQNLTEMLKSNDPTVKHEAISIIANLQPLPPIAVHPSTLLQLINMLYSQGNAIVNTVLFALEHICIQSPSSIETLLKMGLDKAIIQLNFNDENLHTPILILITALAADTSATFAYFFEGVQKTLVNPQYIESENKDLVMQFLLRSKYTGQLPPSIIECAKLDRRYYIRALATCLVLSSSKGYNEEHIELFKTNFNEFLADIDLQREFKENIEQNIIQKQTGTNVSSNKAQFYEMEEQPMQEQIGNSIEEGQKMMSFFEDPLEGLKLFLEFTNEILEDDKKFEDNEEDDDEEEMVEQKQIQEENITTWNSSIPSMFMNLIQENVKLMRNNLLLTFSEGQKIVQLLLRLLFFLSEQYKELITPMLQQSIITMCKSKIPKENLLSNLNIALQIILKNKHIVNRNLYPDLGTQILKVQSSFKECWISLLEIYSTKYNPEKHPVSIEENQKIGTILKKLITDIPETQLEQWRAQTIDTLFDVYSNEQFDDNFQFLGFLPLLNQLLCVGQQNQKKKKSKFIRAVLEDIKRFIAYKNQHIKH